MLPVNFDDLKNEGLDPIERRKINIPAQLNEIPVPPKPDEPNLNANDIINIAKGAARQKALEYLGAEPSTGNLGVIIFAGILIMLIILSRCS